jgi:hypothetical protein
MKTKRALLLAVPAMLVMTCSPAAVAAAPVSDGQVHERVYATTSDGKPLPDNTSPYYGVQASQFGADQPSEMSAQKKANPLPDVPPSHPEVSFAQECQDPANKDKAQTKQGWTKNHYRWCQAVTMVWEKFKYDENGQEIVTDRLLSGTLWLGYADPRARRFVIWGIVGGVVIDKGDFDDDARIAAWADCTGDVGKSSCRSKQEPDIGATLDEIRAGYREFKTTITDTSKENFGLTGDAVASMNVYSWWTTKGGSAHPGDGIHKTNTPVRSRCDSAKLRTSNACIFNNVSPYLTYDKNDTQYPVNELVDHIRYAQDTLNAPGKFANGKPASGPLTRLRDADKIDDNRVKPKQQCKAASPQGWNGKKINCDEFPFASTYQGGASGGPVSGRLINAKQNREGGTQLRNWYDWDRILDKDEFWVETLG